MTNIIQNMILGRRHTSTNELSTLGRLSGSPFLERPSSSALKPLLPVLRSHGGDLWGQSSVGVTGKSPPEPDQDCRGVEEWQCCFGPGNRGLRSRFGLVHCHDADSNWRLSLPNIFWIMANVSKDGFSTPTQKLIMYRCSTERCIFKLQPSLGTGVH